jgi:subtilisin family serine protease
MSDPADESDELPAWSAPASVVADRAPELPWADEVTREWAFSGSDGAGVRVAVVDSGIDASHPLVGAIGRSVAVSVDDEGKATVADDDEGDLCGHGTACAGIIRSLAPACQIDSVRVLGAGFTGSGPVLVAGVSWAVEQGYDVVNLSLSTTKQQFQAALHDLADTAWFRRTVLVAAAHNMPVKSYPWRFASVISVGSHDRDDAWTWYANPDPPVEFYARGYDVEVAWMDGETIRATGNSFATPHITGLVALLRSRHPGLDVAATKAVLHLTASNVGGAR